MSYQFDDDTRVREIETGRFTAELSSRWLVGPALSGGYTMVVALRAVAASLPHPDPLSVTGHFLGPLAPGPADIVTQVVKRGRTVSSGQASVSQDGRERLRLVSLFGELADDPTPLLMDGGPPDLPRPEDCVGNEPGVRNGFGVPMGDEFLYRVPPEDGGMIVGRPSGEASARAWVRLADGRDPDLLALVAIVDALPPVIWEIGVSGWVPTLELTAHLRAHPAPGWLRAVARTRFVQGTLFEEDAEVWDERGRLVAQSRQLALTPG